MIAAHMAESYEASGEGTGGRYRVPSYRVRSIDIIEQGGDPKSEECQQLPF